MLSGRVIKKKIKVISPIYKTYCAVLSLRLRLWSIRFQRNLKKVEKFDRNHGTEFGGRHYWDEIGTLKERANDYSPSPYQLARTLNKLEIRKEDSIVDLGCGKGFAMYVMSQYPFGKIGGVELSEKLSLIANTNLERVMPETLDWEIVRCDVGNWNGYHKYNIFYIYNSFPKKVMEEVKQKIDESLTINPRKITVLYLFPSFPEVFTNDKNYELVRRGSFLEQCYGMHILVRKP